MFFLIQSTKRSIALVEVSLAFSSFFFFISKAASGDSTVFLLGSSTTFASLFS